MHGLCYLPSVEEGEILLAIFTIRYQRIFAIPRPNSDEATRDTFFSPFVECVEDGRLKVFFLIYLSTVHVYVHPQEHLKVTWIY